ncbi:MAG: hypothetical protein SGJ18_14055 [Pseudomonadota bacterium]|nr:hypothetical protein [Pseudomonadota bacterium]
MTKITRIVSVLALVMSGAFAAAEIGPLTEQQKKDFLETLDSASRGFRLFGDAMEKKSKGTDEVYEKIYALVSQGCKFSKNKSEKDGIDTVVLEAAVEAAVEAACPVVMKAVKSSKKVDETVSEKTSELSYQASEILHALNDVLGIAETGVGQTTHSSDQAGRTYHIERTFTGNVVSQKFGKLDYTVKTITDAMYANESKSSKVNSETVLSTKMGDVEIELKIVYKREGEVSTKESTLNGEKVEVNFVPFSLR